MVPAVAAAPRVTDPRWSRQRYRGSQRCQACSVAVATHGSRTTRAVPGLLPLRAAVIVRDIRSGPPRPGGRSSPRPREVGYAGGARHPMRVREQVIGTLTCRSGSDPRRDLYHAAPLRRRPQPPADRASRRRRPRHGPHHQQQGGVTRPVVSTARAGQHGGGALTAGRPRRPATGRRSGRSRRSRPKRTACRAAPPPR